MYTPIIGLEIHLQLKTNSKVFCKCSTLEASPNENICPICLGYPGAMPNLNKEAVLQSIRMGIALNCAIANETNWDRKSYTYPDLFKGYQITQLDQPICGEGAVDIVVRDRRNYYSKDNYTKSISIIRAHLEEDTAKSIHGESETLLDGNKAGFPLLEVVSAPEMNTVDEAVSFAKTVRNLSRWFGVCDGNLELGQMRFDASISIGVNNIDKNQKFKDWKNVEHTPIVEIKNLNSFGNLQDALDYEIKRQIEQYESTNEIYKSGSKETRGWDDKKFETFVQRKKEEANEYRFIPEPDIPTLYISAKEIELIASTLPQHPQSISKELNSIEGFSTQAADLLLEDINLYNVFLKLSDSNESVKDKIANFLTNDLSEEVLSGVSNDWAQGLNSVFNVLVKGGINQNELKQIIKDHSKGACDWVDLISKKTSEGKVDSLAILKKSMSENSGVVDQIKAGKDSAKMFFVGIVMRETKGKADANEIKNLIDSLL